MRRSLSLTAAAAVCAVALSGCGSSSSAAHTGTVTTTTASTVPAATTPAAITGTVVVDAASSLQEIFTTIDAAFEKAHPGTTIKLNLGGSDTLAASITSGAPVDVFASASLTTMATVTKAGDGIGTPSDFAKNEVEIATPPGNPKKITSLASTVKPGVKLILCATAEPCGAAAVKAYAAAKLTAKPVSLEADVKSVLTKIELDEADAGIVYKTDVLAAGKKVVGVNFPQAAQAIATYPIVQVKGAKNAATAQAFIAYVLGPRGQAALRAAGFLKV